MQTNKKQFLCTFYNSWIIIKKPQFADFYGPCLFYFLCGLDSLVILGQCKPICFVGLYFDANLLLAHLLFVHDPDPSLFPHSGGRSNLSRVVNCYAVSINCKMTWAQWRRTLNGRRFFDVAVETRSFSSSYLHLLYFKVIGLLRQMKSYQLQVLAFRFIWNSRPPFQ
jgi:hypothetical protein